MCVVILKITGNYTFLCFRFDGVPVLDIVRIIVPDVAIIAVCVACVVCCRGLIDSSPLHPEPPQQILRGSPESMTWDTVMPYFVAAMLLAGGITLPSLASAIYFLTFLILGTMWSCHKVYRLRQRKSFAYVRSSLTIYSGCHVMALYLYQFQFFQTFLPPESLYARYVGLKSLYFGNQCCIGPFLRTVVNLMSVSTRQTRTLVENDQSIHRSP